MDRRPSADMARAVAALVVGCVLAFVLVLVMQATGRNGVLWYALSAGIVGGVVLRIGWR